MNEINQILNQFGPIYGNVEKQEIHTAVSTENESTATSSPTPEEKQTPLTNRQLVILMTALLDLSLDPEFVNQKALARLIAAVSGKSVESIRQAIIEASKKGFETQAARQDSRTVAELLEKLSPKLATQLRNGAEE